MTRESLLNVISENILKIEKETPVLIGINGVDASGKTFFADELANNISEKTNRHIVKISIDGFHNTEEKRYEKGRNSPEGYQYDSFNFNVFEEEVLKSLNFNPPYFMPVIFDYKMNTPVERKPEKVDTDEIILIEGIFLFQKGLLSYFDYTIFLDVSFDVVVSRAIERSDEKEHIGGREAVIEKYQKRYISGQKLYLEEAKPKEIADMIINNNDFENPMIIRPCTH